MRKIKFVCLILLAAILLTGCAEQEKKEVYTIDEIYNESAYGFFVMNGDKFYPLKTIEAHDENVKWAVGEVKIPKVTKKTPVVAVFKNSSEMPNEYFIEKYNDLGYTLGANIGIGEDDVSLWLNTSNTCTGSDIQTAFSGQGLDDMVEVEAVNDTKPYNNIDTDVNILTGLEKGKYYDLKIFSGTQSLHAKAICADTRVFKLVEKTSITDPLVKTHNRYFVVNLPTNLHKGFYSLNNEGMFQL